MNEEALRGYLDHQTFQKVMDRIAEYRAQGMSFRKAKRRAEKEIQEPEDAWQDWSMTEEERIRALHDVKALIFKAFEGVTLGDGISLHQAAALDDYKPESVVAAARVLDPEARWEEIEDTKVAKFDSALSFVDPAGFRFHIPRFMTWALDNPDSSNFDAAIYACLAEPDLGDHVLDHYSLLDLQQKIAIAKFLAFIVQSGDERYDRYVAAKALLWYWNEYDQT